MSVSFRDNYSLGSAGLAIGSTTSQFSTTRAVAVSLAGVVANCPAVATRAFTAGHAALTGTQTCAIFIVAASDGTFSSVQSPIVTRSGVAGYIGGAWEWPNPSAGAVVGAIVINAGGSAFTPGTTPLTGVATYYDIANDYGNPINY